MDLLGTNQLFLGTGCRVWTDDQFKQAAQWAVAHGYDALLIKVGDGSDLWYGGLSGYQHRRDIVRAQGCIAIAYLYLYGDAFGVFSQEVHNAMQYMQSEGIVCLDLEDKWNNRPDLATALATAARSVPGILLLSTWADPITQAWAKVVPILDPVVNYWMPQVYSNNLGDLVNQYRQLGVAFSKINMSVMIGEDFGPNDPVALAATAKRNGCQGVSLWYYDLAFANAALAQAIVASGPSKKVVSTMTVPSGWTYDAGRKVLKASNGIEIIAGFCQHILNTKWDPNNVPLDIERGAAILEASNPGLGGGTFQLFNATLLEWTPRLGVIEAYVGLELSVTRVLLANAQAENAALTAKLTQTQLTTDAQHNSDVLKSIKALLDGVVL